MPDGPPVSHKTKRPWLGPTINFGLVVLAFTLLGIVLWRNRDQIRVVFAGPLDLRLLALGILIFQISLLITFLRWYILVKVIEPKFTLRSTMLLGFVGYVFNLVIPGAVGGDLIKAAYLVRMHIRRTQAVASMVIDRILGLLGLFVLAGLAGLSAWSMANGDVRKLIMAAWIMMAGTALALVIIFTQALTRLFPNLRQPGRGRLGTIMIELGTMSSIYRSRLDVVFAGLLLSMLVHSLNVLAFYLMGKMLFSTGMATTLGEHFLMVPLTLFTMVVPIPFGALGVGEQVGKQLGDLVGHPNGALAMLSFRVLMYSCGLIAACVYLANIREVRSLTAEAHHLKDELTEGDISEDDADDRTSLSQG
jgi:uncharacterized membrane protein YbhN (UPF0104 family)